MLISERFIPYFLPAEGAFWPLVIEYSDDILITFSVLKQAVLMGGQDA